MSLPLAQFTIKPQVTPFLPPWDEPYLPLEEAVTGGVAIGNGAGGRQQQRWTIFYLDGKIQVVPEAGFPVQFSLTVPLVDTVSLGFDSNMQVTIAYQRFNGSHLYYFNSLSSSYETLVIPDGTSCRACCDDPRDLNSAASDVIFGYIRDDHLYYRQQRDRYTVEYPVGPAHGTLQRAAPAAGGRFQFLVGPNPE